MTKSVNSRNTRVGSTVHFGGPGTCQPLTNALVIEMYRVGTYMYRVRLLDDRGNPTNQTRTMQPKHLKVGKYQP
jgi:hypothetical protein